MSILVTGGAGYLGSHFIACLREAGRSAVVVDNLTSGCRAAVPEDVPLVVGDVADRALIARVLQEHRVDAVVHFAAQSCIAESVRDPRTYWTRNVVATAALLESLLDAGVRTFVLSSTASVYGNAATTSITEDEPPAPLNPFGETTLSVERMLAGYAAAYGLRYAALRGFNSAGADVKRGLGERHDPETHLIPLALEVAVGRRPHVTLFGSDYRTSDGTCIRDYIHVADLADAHLAALDHVEAGGPGGPFNIGTGEGRSVTEVIEACQSVTGREIRVVSGARRAGDPAVLIANPRRTEERLRWRPTRSSLERIIRDAWAWTLREEGRHETSPSTPRSPAWQE